MDNLCHTLVGAAMGEAGLKRRTALAMPALLIGANLPDMDLLAAVNDMLEPANVRLRESGCAGLVLIMDGLDKLVRRPGRCPKDRLQAQVLASS